jgi:nicotinate-nucleotide pyrophosphorylase
MEALMDYETIRVAKISNKAPILFTGVGYLDQMQDNFGVEVFRFYQKGDFVANETVLLEARGKLGNLIRFRDEALFLFSQLLQLSTTLYRLKETVRRNNPSASLIIRTLPAFSPLSTWYFEAIEDANCICWPSFLTDGIIHQEMWKESGGIEKTVEFFKRNWNPSFKLLAECDKLSDGIAAIKNGADGVVIKDIKADMAGEIVKALRERFKKIYLEYNGEISLQNIEQFASLGLDSLSTYRFDFAKPTGGSDLMFALSPAPEAAEPERL